MLQVSNEIRRVFEPDGEPQKVGRTGACRSFDAGAVFNQAFDATERCGALPKRECGGGSDRGGLAPGDADREAVESASQSLKIPSLDFRVDPIGQ